jgi:hypothetical protein
MTENSMLSPPTQTGGDHAHAAVRAALGAIPIAGGAAAELFAVILTPPIERRRLEWMQSVAEGLNRLEERDGSIAERLASDEAFQSTLIQATLAAIKNHQVEKRNALRAVVLKAASGSNINVDWKLLFVRYIDELTPLHFLVLKFLANPKYFALKSNSYEGLALVFEDTYDGGIDPVTLEFLVNDLAIRGLVRVSPDVNIPAGVYIQPKILAEDSSDDPSFCVTKMGEAFLINIIEES